MQSKAKEVFLPIEDQLNATSEWVPNIQDIDWTAFPNINPEKQPGMVCPCCGQALFDPAFLRQLEGVYRAVPFKILGGYRCHTADAAMFPDRPATDCAGRASHLKGIAVDIEASDLNRADLLRALLHAGFDRIGIGSFAEGPGFIHVDWNRAVSTGVAWLCCIGNKSARDRLGIENAKVRFKIVSSHLASGTKIFDMRADYMLTDTGATLGRKPDQAEVARETARREREQLRKEEAEKQKADMGHALTKERLKAALLAGVYRDKLSHEEALGQFAKDNNLSRTQVDQLAAGIEI